ncbi:hypothetical protein P3X46_004451 [Hevea brasiliensis]|uniref:Uncharacterized protein n=1 Tax=Hevea brasiliensis TaxID=3981 RepID=A0ABQ9MWT5_HEVBR|nr:uncharacterized protein LOC110665157 [Hevea brasiliensis]KAJ9184756.1 hypothetical protein P3X46_004451 [Hevea brasiliensis]
MFRWVKFPSTHIISFLQNDPSLIVRVISSNANESHVVSYLVNNCGLSPKSALSASKYVSFKTPKKPDSVLAFFEAHGFSKTHIATLIRKRPTVLLADPEKTLMPKLQFLHSNGFSSSDIAKVLCVCPEILHTSLEKQIIPAFNVIKTFLPSHEKVVCAIKRLPRIMLSHLETYVLPNIKILEESGLPKSSIAWLLRYQPATFMTSSNRFSEIVEEVKGMGLNPLSVNFVAAIHAVRAMSTSTWKSKIDIYKKWGWSEEEILVAFGKHPWCMMGSEKKITAAMDFYINKMGWDSSYIAQHPVLISLGLDKRIVPRCSVIQVLLSKGLMKQTRFSSPLIISEESFLHKFVTPYEEEVPHLLKLYREKLEIAKCKDMEKGG